MSTFQELQRQYDDLKGIYDRLYELHFNVTQQVNTVDSTASKHIIGQTLLFDNYLVEQSENGQIYYVVYFTQDDFAMYYRALGSVMIKTSRACPCIPIRCVVTARSTTPQPKPNRNRQSNTRIEHD